MIILASASPRRQELLRRVVPAFTSVPAAIDERALPVLAPKPYVQSLAVAKAAAVAEHYPAATIIAADTMVALGDRLLGKPATEAEAATMLRQLSGRDHLVHTGLVVRRPGGEQRHTVVTTTVTFWPLTASQLAAYLATGEWRDKAGAYGIQGAGALLVAGIQGDFYNVVGLPISTLNRMLQ